MHRAILTGLRMATALVLASGYLALATTPHYPPAILLLPLMLFLGQPLGERLDRRFPAYRRVTFWVSLTALTVALVSLIWIDLLGSVTWLVIYIQAFTMLHQKGVRNYYHLCLMGFFMLLAACVMNPEPSIGPVMALFLVSSVVAFMLLQIHAEMDRDRGIGTPLVLGLDAAASPAPLAARETFDAGVVRALAGIAVAALILTAGLFLITPRMQAGLLGRSDPMLFRPGYAQTVELARGGRLLRDMTPVMRIEFPEEPEGRFEAGMFWRITTLDSYQESHWARRGVAGSGDQPAFALNSGSRYFLETGRSDTVARKHFGMGRLVRQSIYMDNVPLEGVPGLTLAEKLASTSAARPAHLIWDERGDFTVLLNRLSPRWLQYDVWSEIQEFTPEQLRNAPGNYAEVLPPIPYALLTYHNLEPRTLRLVESIVAGETTVYDKALAIAAYLNGGGYFYTIDLPTLPADHPVDAFIHDTKVGHCELFASAMALMLRSLGIPTRVVAGYRGGEWSASDRAYIVRADMAHLWVEAYFLGLGWATFDPSPEEIGPGGFSRTWIARLVSRYSLKAKMAWYQGVIGFDRGVQVKTWRDLALGLVGMGSDLFDWSNIRRGEWGRARIPLLFIGSTLIAALLASLFLLRSYTGLQQQLLTVDQAKAAHLYRRLRRKLERIGTDTRGKTAEEIRAALQHGQAVATPCLDVAPAVALIDAYNEIRFGGRPLDRARYAQLAQLLRAIRPAQT